MRTSHYIVKYQGKFDSGTIDDLINEIRNEQENIGIRLMFFKKIITITIESLENIFKYTRSFEKSGELEPAEKPYFEIEKKTDNKIAIKAGNPILNHDVENIKDRIEKIKALDADSLKELYIDTIKNGQYTQQGGAGLGFIKIARVCENQINYNFEKIDNNLSFFNLQINLEDKKSKN